MDLLYRFLLVDHLLGTPTDVEASGIDEYLPTLLQEFMHVIICVVSFAPQPTQHLSSTAPQPHQVQSCCFRCMGCFALASLAAPTTLSLRL